MQKRINSTKCTKPVRVSKSTFGGASFCDQCRSSLHRGQGFSLVNGGKLSYWLIGCSLSGSVRHLLCPDSHSSQATARRSVCHCGDRIARQCTFGPASRSRSTHHLNPL